MYLSTLRAKAGEYSALAKMNSQSVGKFLPNFLISEDYINEIEKIKSIYPSKFLIDTRNLETPESIVSLNEYIINCEPQFDINLVYSLDYIMASYTVRSSEYIRISIEDINPQNLSWISQNKSIIPDNIIIDFEYISGAIDEPTLTKVTNLIKILNSHNITILSGSIPAPIPVDTNTNFTQIRYEKQLYMQLKMSSEVFLNYGDYTIISPKALASAGGGIPTVQFKYTTSSEYLLIRNGQLRVPYNFVDVANQITHLPDFDSRHCTGEQFIADIVSENKNRGNATTWITHGIIHHIQLCIDENI
ncbi:beta family protein [Lactococcus lactis]|uniref:beta family protein n=1 Tax=Lactococcus lactis TaxID=1358 RepID=UPI0024A7AD2F|nr:hypothetical protein [Lactococcus lactis]